MKICLKVLSGLMVCLVGSLVTNASYADVIFESATLGSSGHRTGSVISATPDAEQMLGVRFSIDERTRVTEVGGHISSSARSDSAQIFAAIALLPEDELPSAPRLEGLDLVGMVDWTVNSPSGNQSVALFVDLDPGDYLLLFGSSVPGDEGMAVMPSRFTTGAEELGGTDYLTWNSLGGGWGASQNLARRFFVNGQAVPEPSTGVFLLAAFCLLARLRGKRH